ncbi:MAG: hypothetical protein HPY44_10380 [Armatimonadetes bacterium]|nr:hypothetical protein [Armatimonadota bacterium]
MAALEQWLRTECEMKELVLLPAPLWESRQMPDKYYEWYKEDELGVYLWDDREPPDLKLIVGPPEACAWCIAHMGKENGKWVLMKATTSHDEAVDEVIYQRGKGFITREKEPDD